MDDVKHDSPLAPLLLGTLVLFYLVWAAMHDIAHGESDTRLEYTALLVCVPAFAFLYRTAYRRLAAKSRMIWLAFTGLVVVQFDVAAVGATIQPQYAAEPLLGSLFLIAGVPAAALIVYHLSCEALRPRIRAR